MSTPNQKVLDNTENTTTAFNWYLTSAENGQAAAQHNLGKMYSQGLGVQQDYSQAAHWYRKAAEQGYDFGQKALGDLYYEGLGTSC